MRVRALACRGVRHSGIAWTRRPGTADETMGWAMELTERQEQILRTIVDLYVSTARPVGSAAVLTDAAMGVSSATIRNDMAALEEVGYIRQLHTSGGRVPTNAGYRYYVESLMNPAHLSNADARTIRHQFHQVAGEQHEWLKLAATIMAHRMHNVGLITAPRSSEIRLRHMEVISIQSAVVLLIVVLQDGTVLQEMLTLPEHRSQEELSALADGLGATFRGLPARDIETRSGGLAPVEAAVCNGVVHLLRRAEEQHAEVVHAGLTELLRQPEFISPRPGEAPSLVNQRLQHMIEFLHQGFAVQSLMSRLPEQANVQVVIGEESPAQGLRDYSFVLGRYGDADEGVGFLGVVGPTRMAYPRAIALVRYMTDLMNDLMDVY